MKRRTGIFLDFEDGAHSFFLLGATHLEGGGAGERWESRAPSQTRSVRIL